MHLKSFLKQIQERSEEHTSELQSPNNLVCRLLLEKNFFNDTATTEIYTLSLHDALPIYFDEILIHPAGAAAGVNHHRQIIGLCQIDKPLMHEIGRAHV